MTDLSKRLMATGLIEWREGMKTSDGRIVAEDFFGRTVIIGFDADEEYDSSWPVIELLWPDTFPDLSHAGTRAEILSQLLSKFDHIFGHGLHFDFPEEKQWMFNGMIGDRDFWITAVNEAELLVKIAEAIKGNQ